MSYNFLMVSMLLEMAFLWPKLVSKHALSNNDGKRTRGLHYRSLYKTIVSQFRKNF